MSTDEQMTIDERYKYLRCMKKRYRLADRPARGLLLDEMQTVTGLHRKSLIRLLRGPVTRKPRSRQRGRTYGPEVQSALRIIAKSLDYICAERLTPNLVSTAQQLHAHGELHLSPHLRDQLQRISVSTVRRILSRSRPDTRRLPRKPPSRPRPFTKGIPMRRIPWDTPQPGHFEVDLVHHAGRTSSGHYVHSLQMIDVATGWSERRAILGRSWLVVNDAFTHILHHLPFVVREIHSDNGSEFLNAHLRRFWGQAASHITLSRSRPYQKNDNRFVEQKNSTLIRAYLGYERLDTVTQTLLLNQLYDLMGRVYNLFLPVMRLSEKILIPAADGQPARVRRRHDRPRTPFDRLCDTDAITQQQRQRLTALRESVNHLKLREEIYEVRDRLFSLPNALTGITENAHDTLHYPLEPLELAGSFSNGDKASGAVWSQKSSQAEGGAPTNNNISERRGQGSVALSSDGTSRPSNIVI